PRLLPPFPTRRSSDLSSAALSVSAPWFNSTCASASTSASIGSSGRGASTSSRLRAAPSSPPLASCTTSWEMNNSKSARRVSHHRSEEHTSELQSPYDL